MASASPPKPWERGGATTTVPSAAPLPNSTTAAPPQPTPPGASSSSAPPSIPARPSNLTSAAATTTSGALPSQNSAYRSSNYGAMNPYGTGYGTGYGMSSYGGGYGSPYSRMGGMGGMYGSMGGMGMYGGMGPIDPNDPGSLMRGMESSTAATFQMIESIVGAVGGFAQMLESTFMATHSSFFAMVSVAEQFHNLRQTLGSVLGIFTLLRYFRMLVAKLTGRPMPASAKGLDSKGFADFLSPKPKPSRKPLFFFVAAIVGLPYLMTKLIKTLAAAEQKRAAAMNGGVVPGAAPAVDPASLEFARAKWDYKPDGNGQGVDLEVAKGDLVAILGKTGEGDQQWWRCRARDGRVGYLPGGWLEVITRKPRVAGAIEGKEQELNSNASTVGQSMVEEFKKMA
ncbi:hypothetical protein BJ508DRAFT_410097 [Ascobolus immersus RN42]|uniref:Peroxisomal membrane protein PEX13 n=1 Tax=Ascobolus immersus RN42 TaxID=1160509 RepID=A0A3N4IPW1_ASCIM|nr:hypothetical protein BJ508DRAFT_410097 [Ascobolus immersus RN42]